MPQPKPPGRRKLPPPKPALEPNWSWIKTQYRAGLKSTREIARESTARGRKVSHVGIEKRAAREGWERDLKAQVKAKIAEALARDAVTKAGKPVTTDVPDCEIVEAAARQGADVIRSHRNDIAAMTGIANALVAELAAASEANAELREVIVAATTPPADATETQRETLEQRRTRLMKAIGLGSRSGTLKDLVQARRHLIGLERQAFNLNEGEAPDSIEDRLARLEDE